VAGAKCVPANGVMQMWTRWLLFTLAVLLPATVARAQTGVAEIASAERVVTKNAVAYQYLQDGRADDAAGLLRTAVAADPADGGAHQLLCRVYYAEERADNAIHECELAVSAGAENNEQASDNQLWLGRAYGLKAEHAGPLSAFSLARKVQASFARAVELNPSNVAAIDDLGEYDVEAPFVVGGGEDKARALAAQVMPRYPSSAHHLLARLAAQKRDLPTAEAEYKRVIAIEKSTESWIDLADFYQTHGRTDDAVAAVRSGQALDRTHGPALVGAAKVLIAAHREPDLAERCLREYLASRDKSEAAPAFKVHLQLSKLIAARGDAKEASREYEAALALAPAFAKTARQVQGL
jgi:tetratricopeptide (TPR) repeat protein